MVLGFSLSECCNKGTVISQYGCVAGIAGFSNSSIMSCYNLGDINGTNTQKSTNIGGIVGRLDSGTINYTYNTGNINTIEGYIGGITGNNNSDVQNSYNAGNITISSSTTPSKLIGENSKYIGYIIGFNNGTYSSNSQNISTSILRGWSTSDISSNLGSSFKKGANYPILFWE